MTMPTSKPLFYEFTARKKYRVPSWNSEEKNVLCEKGDEITRFDGTVLAEEIKKAHVGIWDEGLQ